MQYRVTIQTGERKNAGTDANVYITLFGSLGNSGERQLGLPNFDDFESGSNHAYLVRTNRSLGDLKQVRIRHDNTGSRPGWFLDFISVHEEESDKEWMFPCQRWLSVGNDDGAIDRTLDTQ